MTLRDLCASAAAGAAAGALIDEIDDLLRDWAENHDPSGEGRDTIWLDERLDELAHKLLREAERNSR